MIIHAVIAPRAEKLAVFDALAPEIRELLDYGPLNPDSAFDALRMQRDLGAAETARRIRSTIAALPLSWAGDSGRRWAPEKTSPLRTGGLPRPE